MLALHGIFENTVLGCRGVWVFNDEEQQREDSKVSRVHGEPERPIEQASLLHPSGDVHNVSRNTDTCSRTSI